jgi:hypothetical protein
LHGRRTFQPVAIGNQVSPTSLRNIMARRRAQPTSCITFMGSIDPLENLIRATSPCRLPEQDYGNPFSFAGRLIQIWRRVINFAIYVVVRRGRIDDFGVDLSSAL